MKKKERMQIDPVDMPQQDPKLRVLNVDEVPTGYTEEMAMLEAKRCIQCKSRPCIIGCPVAVRIPEFLEYVAAGSEGVETNTFGANRNKLSTHGFEEERESQRREREQ